MYLPLFLKGYARCITTLQPRLLFFGSCGSFPFVNVHLQNITCRTVAYNPYFYTIFARLEGMYWRNGHRPRKARSCSSKVRLGPGTNKVFQVSPCASGFSIIEPHNSDYFLEPITAHYFVEYWRIIRQRSQLGNTFVVGFVNLY